MSAGRYRQFLRSLVLSRLIRASLVTRLSQRERPRLWYLFPSRLKGRTRVPPPRKDQHFLSSSKYRSRDIPAVLIQDLMMSVPSSSYAGITTGLATPLFSPFQ